MEHSDAQPRDIRDTRKWTRHHQEHAEISCAWLEGGNHDHYANDSKHSRCDDVPAVFHVATHRPGHDEDKDIGE